MKVIHSPRILQQQMQTAHQEGKTIGFVPTMGYLHAGHLSLLKVARSRCDILVMSIFVNPTQFGANEDLDTYPRDFDRDSEFAKEYGVDILFHPEPADIYQENYATYVQVEGLSHKLCGRSRPTHFRGVTTIVTALFQIVQPDFAVFGQKDAQQAIIIQRLVRDLFIPVEILVVPIVREQDGLAMSSRNTYLSAEERHQALALYKGLQAAKKRVESGEVNSNIIIDEIRSNWRQQSKLQEDYIAIVDLENLEPLTQINQSALIAVAAYVGTTRLIDNIIINRDGTHTLKIQNS